MQGERFFLKQKYKSSHSKTTKRYLLVRTSAIDYSNIKATDENQTNYVHELRVVINY